MRTALIALGAALVAVLVTIGAMSASSDSAPTTTTIDRDYELQKACLQGGGEWVLSGPNRLATRGPGRCVQPTR